MNAQNRQTPPDPNSKTAEELVFQYVLRMHECIKAAEEHEEAVNVRRGQMKGAVIDELSRTNRRVDQPAIDERLDQRLGTDKVYKRMIAGNQWNISKATMYGTAVNALAEVMKIEDKNRAAKVTQAIADRTLKDDAHMMSTGRYEPFSKKGM